MIWIKSDNKYTPQSVAEITAEKLSPIASPLHCKY